MRFLFSFLGGFLDRSLCLALALAATQVPVYIAQYIDVLSGARTEARRYYEDLVAEANKFGLDADTYLLRIEANADTMVRSHARVSRQALERYQAYEAAWQAFKSAPGWLQPFVWLRHRDAGLQEAVVFEPGLNFSLAGLLYAGVGLLTGMLLIGLVKALFGKKNKATGGAKK